MTTHHPQPAGERIRVGMRFRDNDRDGSRHCLVVQASTTAGCWRLRIVGTLSWITVAEDEMHTDARPRRTGWSLVA